MPADLNEREGGVTFGDFLAQYQKMRALQKRFFSGERSLMEQCKEAERATDAMAEKASEPAGLFDLGGEG